ncbi:hypothetical protein [Actinomadura sp. GTD37]|uniref:hypothetical protein n=1 Tax=Actinomadura sp. GTD37 TaxID=1778030 RepID=UPI0035C0933E
MESVAKICGLAAVGLGVAVLAAGCARKPVLKPDGKTVTKAREAARARVDRDLAAITRRVPEFRLLARAELDTCNRGHDNWKIHDPYRSECHLRVAVAYTFAGEFVPRAAALHSVLTGRGWTAAEGPRAQNHWDTGRDRPRPVRGLPAALYQQGTPTPPSSRSLGDVPRTLRLHVTSADESEHRQIHRGIATDMADAAQIRAQGLTFLEYHRTFTGTPWAAPWRTARRPGMRLLVLTFQENYARN